MDGGSGVVANVCRKLAAVSIRGWALRCQQLPPGRPGPRGTNPETCLGDGLSAITASAPFMQHSNANRALLIDACKDEGRRLVADIGMGTPTAVTCDHPNNCP